MDRSEHNKAVVKSKAERVLAFAEQHKAKLLQAARGAIPPEYAIRVLAGAMARNPAILECTEASILHAMLQGLSLGLVPGDALGNAYLVPYRDSQTGRKKAQLIIGYLGLIELAYRHPSVLAIQGDVVCEGDEFDYALGSQPYVRHRKHPKHQPYAVFNEAGELETNIQYAWCVIHTRGGQPIVGVMTLAEIEAHRHRSRAATSGAWRTDYAPMALKTCLRTSLKLGPRSRELEQALAVENAAEQGVPSEDVIDLGEAFVHNGHTAEHGGEAMADGAAKQQPPTPQPEAPRAAAAPDNSEVRDDEIPV